VVAAEVAPVAPVAAFAGARVPQGAVDADGEQVEDSRARRTSRARRRAWSAELVPVDPVLVVRRPRRRGGWCCRGRGRTRGGCRRAAQDHELAANGRRTRSTRGPRRRVGAVGTAGGAAPSASRASAVRLLSLYTPATRSVKWVAEADPFAPRAGEGLRGEPRRAVAVEGEQAQAAAVVGDEVQPRGGVAEVVPRAPRAAGGELGRGLDVVVRIDAEQGEATVVLAERAGRPRSGPARRFQVRVATGFCGVAGSWASADHRRLLAWAL
jgi:hypothetical protein